MGARPYDPALGRFLSRDPIEGGSLNAYEYARQEPCGTLDLDGRAAGDCGSFQVSIATGVNENGEVYARVGVKGETLENAVFYYATIRVTRSRTRQQVAVDFFVGKVSSGWWIFSKPWGRNFRGSTEITFAKPGYYDFNVEIVVQLADGTRCVGGGRYPLMWVGP